MKLLLITFILVSNCFGESQYIFIDSAGTFISDKTKKEYRMSPGYFYEKPEFIKLQNDISGIKKLNESLLKKNKIADDVMAMLKRRRILEEELKKSIKFKDELNDQVTKSLKEIISGKDTIIKEKDKKINIARKERRIQKLLSFVKNITFFAVGFKLGESL